jgi:hypothetical protein
MKADKLLEELTSLAKSLGYSVRRESGSFRGGGCVVHDQHLIIVNRSMPVEAACVIVARALCRLVGTEDTFMKPAVREILQRELAHAEAHPDVEFNLQSNETAAAA